MGKSMLSIAAGILLAGGGSITATATNINTRTISETPDYVKLDADGTFGGHEYIDLGLPSRLLWAASNIGSESPYEEGDRFAWGETKPKTGEADWKNYEFYIETIHEEDGGSWAKLENIGEDISNTEYDAARQIWGNGWRMPTHEELEELRINTWQNGPVEENGFKGSRLISSRNQHSIFFLTPELFPCDIPGANNYKSTFWTASGAPNFYYPGELLDPSDRAYSFHFDASGFQNNSNAKFNGNNIRPVLDRKTLIAGINDPEEATIVDISCKHGIITIKGPASNYIVGIYDMSGKVVYSERISTETIDLSSLAKGVYIIYVSDELKELINKKIII